VKTPASIGVLVLVAALLGGCGEPGASVREGELAPRFEAVTLSGETFDSRSLDGQVVLLNFWATWCRPCLGEIPILQKVEERPGVRVVGIAIDEQGAETVGPFVAEHDIRYGFAIPHTVLLDPDHRIARIYRGPVSEEELDRDLADLLPEVR
jgi:thiol-disulfide isomerase/thioredoxin